MDAAAHDVPVPDPAVVGDLAADLPAAGYTVEGVAALVGPVASAALGREQPLAADLATRGDDSPVATLTRLWLLGLPVSRAALDVALPRTGTDGVRRLGLVDVAGAGPEDEVRARLDLRPYAADDDEWWLASDLSEMATGGPLRPDHVLGVGGASATLAAWTPRDRVGRALDLGTGSGVQAFHLATHAAEVVATDLSRRCLDVAAFNAALNAAVEGGPFAGRTLDLRRGDLLDPVAGEVFDLVVSNPPFVITPRVAGAETFEYRDGGRTGDAVVEQLVSRVGAQLAPGGTAQLLGNWEHHAGTTWQERVEAWVDASPVPLDAWVVQRDVQDPADYAETWARDGGLLPRTPEHDRLVEAWLADFAARGVDGVGFGVVTLHRPTSDRQPWRRLEEVTGALAPALGGTVADHLRAQDLLARTTDDELERLRLTAPADVTEARHGRPGAEDPNVIVLQQGGGLRRTVQLSSELAGLVGACDGDLTVGQIVGALAVLLERPVGELRAELLPGVRGLVSDLLLAAPD